MVINLKEFKTAAQSKKRATQQFFSRLKNEDARQVDDVFHQLHDDVFSTLDCLTCANCCKTTSPIFYQNDIERAAKALRLKPGQVIEKYLRLDEENDYVLQTSPCPFLMENNECRIYESRPKACREYPHTNRKKMVQILDLTAKNTLVCPAVFEMVERIKRIFK